MEGAELGDDGTFGARHHEVFGFSFIEVVDPSGGDEDGGVDGGGVFLAGRDFNTFGETLGFILHAE